MAAMTPWIEEFGEYLESLLDPSVKSKVKQEYIQWVKARESYYAQLKDVAPEFLELLNIIEQHLRVKVEIEDAKEKNVKQKNKEEK